MVKRLASILLPVLVLTAHAVDDPLPKAQEVLPDKADLPEGNYRYPWEMGPLGTIKTEQQWQEQNPPPHLAGPKAAQMIRQIPDQDWAETVKSMKEAVASGMFSSSAAQSGGQRNMIEAIVEHGTKEAAAKAVEEATRGIVDSAVMEYLKVEDARALLQAQPGQEPKPGSVAKLKLELQIWNPAALSNRLAQTDLSGEELTKHVEGTRAVFEDVTRKVVAEKADDLEEDLVLALRGDVVDQDAVNKILVEMAAYASVRIHVKGERPSAGSACHLVFATRGPILDDPQMAFGSSRMRHGIAVWNVSFEVGGKYADTYEQELLEILQLLARLSEPFPLLDGTQPGRLAYDSPRALTKALPSS